MIMVIASVMLLLIMMMMIASVKWLTNESALSLISSQDNYQGL